MQNRMSACMVAALALIGVSCGTVVAEPQAREVAAVDLEASARTALEGGSYAEALELFERASADAQDEGRQSRLEFQRAFTLQQLAAEAPDPQVGAALLMDAAALYESFLERHPQSASGANNLARVYEQIGAGHQDSGSVDRAAPYFAKAEGLYGQAIDAGDSLQGLYLRNYAEMLDRTGEWERAKPVYARIVREQPLSAELQESIEEAHARQGLGELADYLWELLNSGFVREAAGRALAALDESAGAADDARVKLLTLVPMALARDAYDPSAFPGTEFGRRLNALAEDAHIGDGAEQILSLHRASGLNPQRFSWWARQESVSFGGDGNLLPDDSFRALIRALGSRAKLAGRIALAADYFRLAAELQPDEIDPVAVRSLVQMYAELEQPDELERVLRSYSGRLYDAKGAAYRSARTTKIFLYHQTLGELYALIERWGSSDTVASAIFQLEHARDVSRWMEDLSEEPLPPEYRFTPGMAVLLARGYEATHNSAAAEALLREEARRYEAAGDQAAAAAVLKGLQ